MPQTSHLNVPLSVHVPTHVSSVAKATQGRMDGFIQAISLPFPFGMKTRNALAVLLVLVAIGLFWVPFTALYSLSQDQAHYSHIVLIPWISLYALYLERKAILSSQEWSPVVGGIVIGLSAVLYWLGETGLDGTDRVSMTMLAFVVSCWGIVLLCFGAKQWRAGSFGLLFLLFMVPLPSAVLDTIIGFLQKSSTEVVDVIYSLLGIPVFRQGFVFSLSNFTIHVAEECSGIRSTLSLFVTSIVAAHFFLRSGWAKLGLVALVVPMAITKNAFRIVGLSLLANYVDPSFITDSALHRFGGIPLFALSLGILFSIVWLFRKMEKSRGYYPS